jgi:hypothetical protein
MVFFGESLVWCEYYLLSEEKQDNKEEGGMMEELFLVARG